MVVVVAAYWGNYGNPTPAPWTLVRNSFALKRATTPTYCERTIAVQSVIALRDAIIAIGGLADTGRTA